MEALGESSVEDAIEVMKQIANEFIIEQEGEDKLNREIDGLLDGVDLMNQCHLVKCHMKACLHILHHLKFR